MHFSYNKRPYFIPISHTRKNDYSLCPHTQQFVSRDHRNNFQTEYQRVLKIWCSHSGVAKNSRYYAVSLAGADPSYVGPEAWAPF